MLGRTPRPKLKQEKKTITKSIKFIIKLIEGM